LVDHIYCPRFKKCNGHMHIQDAKYPHYLQQKEQVLKNIYNSIFLIIIIIIISFILVSFYFLVTLLHFLCFVSFMPIKSLKLREWIGWRQRQGDTAHRQAPTKMFLFSFCISLGFQRREALLGSLAGRAPGLRPDSGASGAGGVRGGGAAGATSTASSPVARPSCECSSDQWAGLLEITSLWCVLI